MASSQLPIEMPEAEEANYAFFLAKLPQPVDGYYTLRTACFKKGSNFRQILKLKTVESTESHTELDLSCGQLFQFSSADDPLEDYSIIVINKTALPHLERNMFFPELIRYRMETYVTADNLSIPGVYMDPVLGEIKDPMGIVQLGQYRLLEFEVVIENENFRCEILETPDMKLIDLLQFNMDVKRRERLEFIFDQPGLNKGQNYALKMAVNTKHSVVCIHGAPGTGKTLVLAHLLNLLRTWNKQAIVLTSTDESLEKLRQMSEDISKQQWNRTLNIMDQWKFEVAFNTLGRVMEWRKQWKNEKISEEEFKQMVGIYKKTEGGEEIMNGTNFVFATFDSYFIENAMRLKSFKPCMMIIDNGNNISANQLLPACFQNMRMIIAGDPFQLYPINVGANSTHKEVSIVDEIINNKDKFCLATLNEHRRCNAEIVRWSYATFYKNVRRDKLMSLGTLKPYFPKNSSLPKQFRPLVFIDTSAVHDEKERVLTYEKLSEHPTLTRSNYENIAEKNYALQHYQNLQSLGVAAKDIGILTCYQGQVNLIRTEMERKIEKGELDSESRKTMINTVDNVQGLEFEVVIFSMVRNNPMRTMGIVTDPRRMNVLMTRARLQLFFIGNGFMMAQNHETKIQDLVKMFCSNGQRFHPNSISHTDSPLNLKITNNFGLNFQAFAEYTNDPLMEDFCAQKERERVEREKKNSNGSTKTDN